MSETPWIVVGRSGPDVHAILLDADGAAARREDVPSALFPEWVAAAEGRGGVRWVWSDTTRWYPALLSAGVRVARCHDLRLARVILHRADAVPAEADVRKEGVWDLSAEPTDVRRPALFEWEGDDATRRGVPDDAEAALTEFAAQRRAVAESQNPGRLRLLVAAESAGGLTAAEISAAGLPWDRDEHDRLLTAALGRRSAGGRPERLEAAAREVRVALGEPTLSLDSPPKLLRALRRAGLDVDSTSRWELAEQSHPVIPPLLEYKRLARLLSANGWAWLDEWVHDGRFRPVLIPGGVVTGRWASSGGGALQLPRQLRPAVRADPGWCLVVADVAQLEPRVLAAMSGDVALAEAARGRDLYEGVVAASDLTDRAEAKVALLGAMYGATTGQSGRLLPMLRRSFPRAMSTVDAAARAGEDGERVRTWLGRTSPAPPPEWASVQASASEAGATSAEVTRARRRARDRGRFTRNFVVQGTAAEWALAWLADMRGRLIELPSAERPAPASGPVFAERAHLAFFLHDEVIVHAPAEHADAVVAAARDAAQRAGGLLFGDFPIDFPLDIRVGASAAK